MDNRRNSNIFSDNQRIKLIGLIKKYPFLYDKTHVVYNKKILREKVWREIAKQVDADENTCRQSWRSMRDQYYRSIYQMRKYNQNKKYKHFHLLTFLGEHPQPRGKRCHVDYELEKKEMQKELWLLDSTNDDYADDDHETDDNNTNASHENVKHNFNEVMLSEDSIPCINSPSNIPNSKKRKLTECIKIDKSPLQSQTGETRTLLSKNNYRFDKYDHFFLSISSTVRDYGLSLARLADLQCSVIKCVTTELEKISEDI